MDGEPGERRAGGPLFSLHQALPRDHTLISLHSIPVWNELLITISQMRRQAQGSNGPLVTVTQQKDGPQTCALVPGERVHSQSWSLSGSLSVFNQMKVMILTSQGCVSQNEIRQVRSLAYIRCSDVPAAPPQSS